MVGPRLNPDPNLVFLCGFPSSGTDLLKNVMNAHPDICIAGEFPFLPRMAIDFESVVPRSDAGRVVQALRQMDVFNNFDRRDFRPAPDRESFTFAELYASMLSEKRYKWQGNKTPQNTEHIGELRQLFPEAKFILIVRDVRDVALSWNKKWGRSIFLCAAKWNHRMQIGLSEFNNLGGGSGLVVRFEDLLDDIEKVSAKICGFLDLEFQPAMLSYHREVGTTVAGKLNYGKPLLRGNKDKWRLELTQQQIGRVEEIALATMTIFGYPITSATRPRPLTALERYSGYIRDAAAMLFIGNRALEDNDLGHRLKMIFLEIRKMVRQKVVNRYK